MGVSYGEMNNKASNFTFYYTKVKRLLLIFLLFSCVLNAQTRKKHARQREIGIFGGASYYLGDLNTRTHFVYSKPAAGAFFRMAMTYRYAFRFGFNYGSVWASDSKSGELNQIERDLHFKSDIYEAHALYEFNFVDYRIGKDKLYFTMFLFAGIGGYYMNPKADLGSGYVNLTSLNTEGQGHSYSKYQICVPFGVGIKWNATDIFGFGFEWGPRKLFTDYLDDASKAFPYSNNANTVQTFGTGDPGTMRGNPKSKDWYFYYGFTLQMRLPKKNAECHGMGLGI
ncbi:MAG TPA: DUF6089 family protein [Bacteroidia bacterium]|nr:DUF6089 family protein [Bacteroidia bacterium]